MGFYIWNIKKRELFKLAKKKKFIVSFMISIRNAIF